MEKFMDLQTAPKKTKSKQSNKQKKPSQNAAM